MPGIGVISNRNARLNRLNPMIKEQLAFVIGSDGEVASTGSLDDVYDVISTFKRVDIDIIAISGGDGTSHRTMEIILEVYKEDPLPAILLLPTGTQNMVPRSFGIKGNGQSTLLLAVSRYRHNIPMKCVKRNLLIVNGHASFMFGIGIGPRFMVPYYESNHVNAFGAVKLLGSYLLDSIVDGSKVKELAAVMDVSYQIDDEARVEGEKMHTFFCSFVERLPLHFELFPRAGQHADKFEVVYGNASPFQVFSAFPRILNASLSPIEGLSRRLAKKVVIDLGNPEKYTLDGDLYGPCDHFEISAGPEVKFVVPDVKIIPESSMSRYDKVGPWPMRFLI